MTEPVTDWKAIYSEYEFKVRSYIKSHVGNSDDIDDLCGEVFLSVMKGKDSFSGNSKAVSSWIYMITRHTVALFYRKRRISCDFFDDMADDSDMENQIINAETLDILAKSMEKLDTRLRDIIILHYYGGKALKDIASAMNMSYPNMKILHKKALGQLKLLMV